MQINKEKLCEVLNQGIIFNEDEKYMIQAILSSASSPDPSSQVGCCIVKNGEVLSTGYNHIPINWKGDFIWNRNGKKYETKYAYIHHSEVDGIRNYKGNNDDLKGSTLYVTLFPCDDCARQMVLYGINKVVYLSDKYAFNKNGEPNEDNLSSKILFKTCGVEVVNFNMIKTNNFELVEECYDQEIIDELKQYKLNCKKYIKTLN